MLRLRESFLRRTEAAQQQRRAAAAQLAASVPQVRHPEPQTL